MVRLRVEFTGLLTLTRTVSACLGSVAMPVTQSQHQSIQSRQRHEVQHPRPRQWQQQRPAQRRRRWLVVQQLLKVDPQPRSECRVERRH